jgi:hypothetical protein
MALLLAALGSAADSPDERAITALVLRSAWNATYGGDAVADPSHRRIILLHRVTIAPSEEQLRVRVFSPANREAGQLYRELRAAGAMDDLRRRNATPVPVHAASYGFRLGEVRRDQCGPRVDSRRWLNAAAVSRPGFTKDRRRAIVYVELTAEGRAYLLEQVAGEWQVIASVELWACG